MLRYLTGDATEPLQRPVIIAHCVNNAGKWGRGFVMALSGRWPLVRDEYIGWSRGQRPSAGTFELGTVQFVEAERDVTVANIVGQDGIRTYGRKPPIRYDALRIGLRRVALRAESTGAIVQMPRIGAGLAGGDWTLIEPILQEAFAGVDAVVFDLPASPAR